MAKHGATISAVYGIGQSSRTPLTTERCAEAIREAKQLVKTIVMGMKTILWSLSNLRAPVSQNATRVVTPSGKGMTDEECQMSSQYFGDALVCFTLLEGTAVDASGSSKPGQPVATPKSEQKELLELFSGAFTVLEIQNFREVIGRHIMPHLFDLIVRKPQFVVIPQNFLRNSNVTRVFVDILLTFIISRLKSLGEKSAETTQTLTLCKMLFSSVFLFPDNEPVLRSHLRSVITNCLRYSAEVKDPIRYFQLLRSLFKSIEGGKFEGLYKELQPLLPELLSSLIKLQHTADPSTRSLFVELCLTVSFSSSLPLADIS